IRNGLPPVPVPELRVHPRDGDLIIGTHGRGIYIMDDITPLRQMAAASAANVFLFDPRTAIRWQTWGRDGNLAQKEYAGTNPPRGAILNFAVKTAGPATFTIAGADGQVVRTLNVPNAVAGVNRVVWDLRYDAPNPGAGGRGGPASAADAASASQGRGGRG